jgi:hypothetical protein
MYLGTKSVPVKCKQGCCDRLDRRQIDMVPDRCSPFNAGRPEPIDFAAQPKDEIWATKKVANAT